MSSVAEPAIRGRWLQGSGAIRVWSLQRPVPDAVAGVLLLHGYGEHSGRYTHVIEGLAQRGFALVAPDHRGHGRTARVPGDLESVDAILEDLAWAGDALERLAPGRPVYLLGHSMGALLALLLAGRERRWAGAVLNGTALTVPEQISPLARSLARVGGRALPWLGLQRFYDPHRGSRDPAVAAANLADPFQYKGRLRARTGLEVLQAMARAEVVAPTLRLPVLLTHGGDDRTVPIAASARLHTRIGSGDKEFHRFDGLRHEVHQEPERAAVIARWGIWMSRRAKALR